MSDDPKPYTAAEARDLAAAYSHVGDVRIPPTLRRYARMLEAREPPAAVVTDALHPTGRCTCTGEGRCAWCKRDAARAPVEPAAPLSEPIDMVQGVPYGEGCPDCGLIVALDGHDEACHLEWSATPPSAPVVEGVRDVWEDVVLCTTIHPDGTTHEAGCRCAHCEMIGVGLIEALVEARVEQVLGDLEYRLSRDRGRYEDEVEHARTDGHHVDEDVSSGMVVATDAAIREVNALRTRTQGDGK